MPSYFSTREDARAIFIGEKGSRQEKKKKKVDLTENVRWALGRSLVGRPFQGKIGKTSSDKMQEIT